MESGRRQMDGAECQISGNASPTQGQPSLSRKEWTPCKVAAAYCDHRSWDEETLYAVIDCEMDWDYFEMQYSDERDE